MSVCRVRRWLRCRQTDLVPWTCPESAMTAAKPRARRRQPASGRFPPWRRPRTVPRRKDACGVSVSRIDKLQPGPGRGSCYWRFNGGPAPHRVPSPPTPAPHVGPSPGISIRCPAVRLIPPTTGQRGSHRQEGICAVAARADTVLFPIWLRNGMTATPPEFMHASFPFMAGFQFPDPGCNPRIARDPALS